jgi:DNA-binding response OmpR family regulator
VALVDFFQALRNAAPRPPADGTRRHRVSVVIGNRQIDGWIDYDILNTMLEPADGFSLTRPFSLDAWKLCRLDEAIKVAIDGIVILDGYIDDRARDAKAGTMEIAGRDKSGRLVQTSIPNVSGWDGLQLDEAVRRVLSFPRERDGYRVVQAVDGADALGRFDDQPVDLVVLDIMLPKLDGLEVCKQLRTRSSVPIIMLTARDDELDKVLGLELGADDYITKPFSIREFRSRVRALLRRAAAPRRPEEDGDVISAEDLTIDLARRTVEVRAERTQLTYVEFELLRILAANPGRVYSRRMLLEALWGGADYREPRTIDVHVRHLREKLERDPADPEYILTVRGVGYRFRDR